MVTIYKAPTKNTRASLAAKRCLHEKSTGRTIFTLNAELFLSRPRSQVSTVDGFQGKEVDVVLFSCVRAPSSANGGYHHRHGNGGGGIGFLADQRRMNVAITRAKVSLIVLGNARRLSSDGNWRALVEHAASRGRVIESRAGDGGEAICARLEARAGNAAAARRSRNGQDGRDGGDHGPRRSSADADVDSARDGGTAARGDDCDDDSQPTTKRQDAPRSRRGSASGHPQDDRGTASRSPRSREGDRTDRRQDRDGAGGTGRRQRKPARRSDNDNGQGEANPPPTRAEDVAGRDRTPTQLAGVGPTSVAAGAAAVVDPKRRRGGADRPLKRPRVAAGSESGRGGAGSGSGTGASKRVPSSASISTAPPPKPVKEGFLAGLLGSLTANADGIASGKDHAFRQGLRGGEVSEYSHATGLHVRT